VTKDYIEHLRTVHFSLIAICIALGVVVSSTNRREVSRARAQLQLINESLRSWNPDALNSFAKLRMAELSKQSGTSLPTSLFVPAPPNANVMVMDSEPAKPDLLALHFTEQNWMIEGRVRSIPSLLHRQWLFPGQKFSTLYVDHPYITISAPETLTQFRQLWDALASTKSIVVPTKLATTLYTWRTPEGDREHPWNGRAESLSITKRGFHLEATASAPEQDTCTFQLARTDPSEDSVYKAIAAALAKSTPYFYVCLELTDNNNLSFVPVTDFRTIDFDSQGVLLDLIRSQQVTRKDGPLVPHGTFEYSFSSLNEITKNYQQLSLNAFGPILESEQQRAGESFEALGIKFPADQVTRWGLLILLAVQSYLCVMLRERSQGLPSSDAECGVPWVGLYGSLPAQAVCFLTVVILPAATCGLVGVRGARLIGFNWAGVMLIGSGSIAASLVLALHAWSNLPSRVHSLRQNDFPPR